MRNYAVKVSCLASILHLTVFPFLGCSFLRASPAPTTPFLVHGELLHPWYKNAPWDGVWSSDPGKIMARRSENREMYIAPVNIGYLNKEIAADGNWITTREINSADVQAITDQLRTDFRTAIESHPESNIHILDTVSQNGYILEIALVELVPTKAAVNVIADVGALLIPGVELIDHAARRGVHSSGAVAAGTIAIEIKLVDAKSGMVLAEIKDRQNDPVSILPNYRDFEKFGWSRRTISDWSQQFAAVFSTSLSQEVGNSSELSVLPW